MLTTDSSDNTVPSACFKNNGGFSGRNGKLRYEGGINNVGVSCADSHFLSTNNSVGWDNSFRNNGLVYQHQPYSSLATAASDPVLGSQQSAHEYSGSTTFTNLYASGTYSSDGPGSGPHESAKNETRESPPSCARQQYGASSQQYGVGSQQQLQGNIYTDLQALPRFASCQQTPGLTNPRPLLEPSVASNFQPYHGGLSMSTTHPYNPVNPLPSPFPQTTTCSSGEASNCSPWPHVSDSSRSSCVYQSSCLYSSSSTNPGLDGTSQIPHRKTNDFSLSVNNASSGSMDNTNPSGHLNTHYGQQGNNKFRSANNTVASSGNVNFLSTNSSAACTSNYINNGLLYQPQPYSSLIDAVSDPGGNYQHNSYDYTNTTPFNNPYGLGTYNSSLNPYGTTRDDKRTSPASCALQQIEARPQQQLQEHVHTDLKPLLRYSPNHTTPGSSGLRSAAQSPGSNKFHPYYGRLPTSTVHPRNSVVPLSSPSCQSNTCSPGPTPRLLTLPYLLDNRYLPGNYSSSVAHDSHSPFMPGNPQKSPDFSAILTACDREPGPGSSRRLVSRNNSSTWIARGKDNCTVTLNNGDMWAKFHTHTNEMIVTKHGRRMFPVLHFKISGLEPEKQYRVFVDMILADDSHWKFQGGKWVPCGNADSLLVGGQTYQHPDSPNTGAFWCKQEVSFGKLKLTNNKATKQKQIVLNSMHRYQPRIIVTQCQDEQQEDNLICHAFEDTQFIAVTAYQNTDITDLKVKFNPYARGMQDKNRSNADAIFPSSGQHQLNFLGEPPLNQYIR